MANFTYFLNRQGARGQKGEKGDQGFSPIITVATNTLSEYVLRIQTQDNTFLTANLREHKEDAGGTYIRYDRETGLMYAGAADVATTTQQGEVRFANSSEVASLDETTVVTPADVNTIVESKNYDGAIDGLDTRLTSAEGTIVDQGNAITALQGQMTGVLGNYVTTNTVQIITGRKTFEQFRTDKIRTSDGTTYINTNGTAPNLDMNIGAQNNIRDISLISERKVEIISPLVNIHRNNQTYSNIDSGNISDYLPTVPTKTSDLTNDSGFITSADLPTVGDGTITFTQGGVTKGTITTNQSGNTTIALDAGGSNLTAGTAIDITSDAISVNYDSTKGLVATNNALGISVDGTTIDFDASGNLKSIASAPSNMVTTDTEQTISGTKTFSQPIHNTASIHTPKIYAGKKDQLSYSYDILNAHVDSTTSTTFRTVVYSVNDSTGGTNGYIRFGNEYVNTQLVGLTVKDSNGNTYLTSGNIGTYALTSSNISTDQYIAALEARITALETNINGGNA